VAEGGIEVKDSKPQENLCCGINVVKEALLARRPIESIHLVEGWLHLRLQEILHLAKERGVTVHRVPRRALDRMAEQHQGVVARLLPMPLVSTEEMLARAREKEEAPFLLAVEGVQDPRNLGALIRTAAIAGVHGLILPSRRAAPLSAAAIKSSAGGVFSLPIGRVTNLNNELRALKDKGLWVVGTARDGETPLYSSDLTLPLVLVVGSEDRGISPSLCKLCDLVVSIPQRGSLNSLNLSVAGSIVIYEVARQRGWWD
jgi:23S rRNA (guanosine2251-2'-O)-methyltransferase